MVFSDGGMAKEWSADPLEIPLGPITRARAKRFKEALNVLIQHSQAEGAHGLNSRKETKLVHVIKVNPNLNTHGLKWVKGSLPLYPGEGFPEWISGR